MRDLYTVRERGTWERHTMVLRDGGAVTKVQANFYVRGEKRWSGAADLVHVATVSVSVDELFGLVTVIGYAVDDRTLDRSIDWEVRAAEAMLGAKAFQRAWRGVQRQVCDEYDGLA